MFSLNLGWLSQSDHCSGDETRRTDWPSPPIIYRILAKIWTQTGVPCRKPRLSGGHVSERRGQRQPTLSPWLRVIWAREWNEPPSRTGPPWSKLPCYPGRVGGRVIKSSEMWDQGLEGTGSGWRSPSGGRLEVLPVAQAEQANTKSWTSWAIRGHQNRCLTKNLVRLTPGWQATLEQCPHWMTSDLTDSGTNKRLGGPPAGGVTPCKALLTFDSTSHTSVETNRLSGKMHSGVDGRSDGQKYAIKASGLTFWNPGGTREQSQNVRKKVPTEPAWSSVF